MQFKYSPAPHYHSNLTTQRIMRDLTLGLGVVYAFALYKSYLLGTAYLVNAIKLMVAALLTALITEAVYAKCTNKKVKVGNYLKNSFGWITAMIIVLMVPVNTQVYAVVVSTFIAIFFGKLVFGGFGQNVFNPAAVGRAIIGASFAGSISADLITSATPTQTLSSAGWLLSAEGFNTFLSDFGGISNLLLGNYAGSLGETSALLIIIVGVFLAIRKVIDWRIPVTYIGVIFFATLFVGMSNGLGINYALFHCLTGGAMFGAVFMLTDPVTNPNTRAGRIVFAAIAAFLTLIIRFLGNLPEGVLFSILLVNILTPVIDKFFDGKQVLMTKKINITVACSLILSIVVAGLLGNTLTVNNDYQSINKPAVTFEVGDSINLNEDLKDFTAQVIESDGTHYVVEVKGFGLIVMADNPEYSVNTIEIDVENGKVTNLVFKGFGDTEGLGDQCLDETFLAQFIDKGLEDSVDLVSGATYTSKSVVSAVQAALNGQEVAEDTNEEIVEQEATPEVETEEKPSEGTLEIDFNKGDSVNLNEPSADCKATVVSNEDNVYHVTSNGMGLNEFDITIEDGKVTKIEFTVFGDTEGLADVCTKDTFLNQYIGKGLEDQVDILSGCTVTSTSVNAAVNAALEAANE